MLKRSIEKLLYANGQVVTENADQTNEDFTNKFNNITDEDEEAGFIYIPKSKSDKKEIKEINNLFKIGFSKTTVEDRVKNAFQEPTYLMADVRIVMAYKCYNMNPQKLEQLHYNFFGNSCLNIDVFDKDGNRWIFRHKVHHDSETKYATIPRQSTPRFRGKGYHLFQGKVHHFVKEAVFVKD